MFQFAPVSPTYKVREGAVEGVKYITTKTYIDFIQKLYKHYTVGFLGPIQLPVKPQSYQGSFGLAQISLWLR